MNRNVSVEMTLIVEMELLDCDLRMGFNEWGLQIVTAVCWALHKEQMRDYGIKYQEWRNWLFNEERLEDDFYLK